MSFILDALKKSETDRQQQGSAEFSTIPSSDPRRTTPRWLWLLVALLAVNILVLLVLLLRPEPQTPVTRPAAAAVTVAPQPVTESTDTGVDEESFDEQVAAAKARREQAAATTPAATPARAAPVVRTTEPPPVTENNLAALPSALELRANGELELPDMHVDIHVFSDVPAERFVFINMDKQREGSTLKEGPTVREITEDGVVLEYRGRQFMLPRE